MHRSAPTLIAAGVWALVAAALVSSGQGAVPVLIGGALPVAVYTVVTWVADVNRRLPAQRK